MMYRVTKGPGIIDLIPALFGQTLASFEYLGEEGGVVQLSVSVRSMFLCDGDSGEKRHWVILGENNACRDSFFVLYDAQQKTGLLFPFYQGKNDEGLTEKQIGWALDMQRMMSDGLYEVKEPLDWENISALRFSMLMTLSWANGMLCEAHNATMQNWREIEVPM